MSEFLNCLKLLLRAWLLLLNVIGENWGFVLALVPLVAFNKSAIKLVPLFPITRWERHRGRLGGSAR